MVSPKKKKKTLCTVNPIPAAKTRCTCCLFYIYWKGMLHDMNILKFCDYVSLSYILLGAMDNTDIAGMWACFATFKSLFVFLPNSRDLSIPTILVSLFSFFLRLSLYQHFKQNDQCLYSFSLLKRKPWFQTSVFFSLIIIRKFAE